MTFMTREQHMEEFDRREGARLDGIAKGSEPLTAEQQAIVDEALASARQRHPADDAGRRADDAREEQKAEQAYAQMLAEQDTTTSATTRSESADDLCQIGDPPTLTEASAAFNEATKEPCETIVGLLSGYDVQRTISTVAASQQKAKGARIKAHLESCTHDHRDGEHDLDAFLEDKAKQGQGDGVLDVRTMAEKHPQMLIALALAGSISADVAMVKKQQALIPAAHDAMQRYLMPGERTVSLAVKKRGQS